MKGNEKQFENINLHYSHFGVDIKDIRSYFNDFKDLMVASDRAASMTLIPTA